MKAKMKYLAVVSLLLLLSNISFLSHAEDIAIDGGIGLHDFNLSEGESESEGQFTIINQDTTVVDIELDVILQLDTGDFDGDGNPRIHKTIDANVVFDEMPENWIVLPIEEVTVQPLEVKKIYYDVVIPEKYLSKMNNETGYLCYISIKGVNRESDLEGSGGSIGVNYKHKCFLRFSGDYDEYLQGRFYITVYFIISVVAIGIAGSFTILDKVKKSRRRHRN